MSKNGGIISGRVFKNWEPKAPKGLWVTLVSLTLGGSRFEISPSRPETRTASGGHFALGFEWEPSHIGLIDQYLRATIVVMNSRETLDRVRVRVGLYVSLGRIWKGSGGPSLARDLPDVIGCWTDVYETVRKIPVPKIIKQTGWMSTEAFALYGHTSMNIR